MSYFHDDPPLWVQLLFYAGVAVMLFVVILEKVTGIFLYPVGFAMLLATCSGTGFSYHRSNGWFPIGLAWRILAGLLAFGCLIGQGAWLVDWEQQFEPPSAVAGPPPARPHGPLPASRRGRR